MELHLSPEPESLSYRAVQAAVAATGGTVTRARRDAPGENRAWHVEITPNQGDNITLTLPALPCDAKNALCIDGEPLEAGAAATVSGQPFRAWFNQAPEEHDGENAFDLRLHFSHETEVSYRTVQDHLLSVKGGEIQRGVAA